MSDYAKEFDGVAEALTSVGGAFRSIEIHEADRPEAKSQEPFADAVMARLERRGDNIVDDLRGLGLDRLAALAEEDAELLRAYREALKRIADTLDLPGSPDLVHEVPQQVERVLRQMNRRCDELEDLEDLARPDARSSHEQAQLQPKDG